MVSNPRIENVIISHLVLDENYCRSYLHYIKPEYFGLDEERIIVKTIIDFYAQYDSLIPMETLKIKIGEMKLPSSEKFNRLQEILNSLKQEDVVVEWLRDETEKFCQNMSARNAVLKSANMIENGEAIDGIPIMLQDAVSISFDKSIGHDYQLNAEERFDFFSLEENRLPFHLTHFNLITKGGMTPGTVTCLFAGTGFGKSLVLCDFSAKWLQMGLNVLYITLEMSEEHIASRIDANLLDVSMDEIYKLDRQVFINRVNTLKGITNGKLYIKQLPSSSTHAGNIKSFIEELRNKKSFYPNVLVIDYIGKMVSQRDGKNIQKHEMGEYVADEVRDIATKYNIQVFTANQFNRDGQDNTDPGLTNIGDSFAQARVYDLALGLSASDKKEEQNQMLVKQLKNRSASRITNTYFNIGVDWDKMRLYDLEESAQESLRALNGGGNTFSSGRETISWGAETNDG